MAVSRPPISVTICCEITWMFGVFTCGPYVIRTLSIPQLTFHNSPSSAGPRRSASVQAEPSSVLLRLPDCYRSDPGTTLTKKKKRKKGQRSQFTIGKIKKKGQIIKSWAESTSLAFQSLIIKVKVILQVLKHFHLLFHVLLKTRSTLVVFLSEQSGILEYVFHKSLLKTHLHSLSDILQVVLQDLLLLCYHCSSGMSCLSILHKNQTLFC